MLTSYFQSAHAEHLQALPSWLLMHAPSEVQQVQWTRPLAAYVAVETVVVVVAVVAAAVAAEQAVGVHVPRLEQAVSSCLSACVASVQVVVGAAGPAQRPWHVQGQLQGVDCLDDEAAAETWLQVTVLCSLFGLAAVPRVVVVAAVVLAPAR